MKKLNVLRIGTVENLDPIYCSDTAEKLIFDNVCETLFVYQYNAVQPCIVKNFVVNPNGLEYNLILEKNKKFSDGTEITARIVVDNLQRVKESNTAIGYTFKRFIQSINITSETEIVLTLRKKCSFFLFLLTTANTAIAAKQSLKALQNGKNTELIGSGAYKIEKITTDEIILSKNKYYKQNSVYCDTVKVIISGSIDKRNQMLQKEELDISQFDIHNMHKISQNYYAKFSKCFDTMCFLFNFANTNNKLFHYLKDLRIKTEFRELPWKHFLQAQQKGDFDIMLVSMAADYPDPHNFISEFYGRHGSFTNISSYSNKFIYWLVDMGASLHLPNMRLLVYSIIQKITSWETAYIWLGQTVDFRMYHKTIEVEAYSPFWGEYLFSKIKKICVVISILQSLLPSFISGSLAVF